MAGGRHVDSNIHLRAKSVKGSLLDAREVEGMEELFRTLDKLGDFGKDNVKEVRNIHKAAGVEIRDAIKAEITPHGGIIKVRRSGKNEGKEGPSYNIANNTLRKSIKVFKAKRSKFTYLVGPRSQMVFDGKISAGAITQDGYFAHMVDKGIMPTLRKGTKGFTGGRGMQSGTPNKGFFKRGIAKGIPMAMKVMEAGYAALMEKILRK
jgi:hypothetical protein